MLVIYGIGFAFATAAAGLSEAFPVWLSLLIVRSLAVFMAACLVVVAFVTWRMGKRKGAQTMWKLVK